VSTGELCPVLFLPQVFTVKPLRCPPQVNHPGRPGRPDRPDRHHLDHHNNLHRKLAPRGCDAGQLIMILLHCAALIAAIVLTPWFLARLLDRHADTASTFTLWGPIMVGLNSAVAIVVHLARIPLTPDSLALAHLLTLLVVTVILFFPATPSFRSEIPPPRLLMECAILFAMLVVPVSHIAGIDTYKWQDLAGSVAVEGRIAWLAHPLSLLGFTPRSYPSAQPLLLATIEMLGHTGVDWGFYVLSVALGLTGLFGAWRLGRHLFTSEQEAVWFAFLYTFSPLFMRYNYWATGRGLLLALLPVYLLTLLRFPTIFERRPHWPLHPILWIPSFLTLSLLLAMAHKAGFIGTILLPILFLSSPILIVARGKIGLCVLMFMAIIGGLILVDFSPVAFTYRIATRFGWLAPLAVLGLCGGSSDRFNSPATRCMLAGGLVTLILSCTADMYGALLALPFITFASVAGFSVWKTINPFPHIRPARCLFIMTLLTAITIIANQASDSPSPSLYRAALFLEQYDPQGPFQIVASGRARTQVQAYVSGCPRFTMESTNMASMDIRPRPKWNGHPVQDARAWINYLRNAIDLRGVSTDWYGGGNKVYYITVKSEGITPPKGTLIFHDGEVKVFSVP